ncbi:hypothetical protein [Lysobacter sp. Root604]|uniref:hypothetical protein n=1 Tax=Lysobacter sp. Root604 TaxID=1736568 RepID=UPI0012F8DC27|nr:hypothetical protein [Lysobacter sp. Root604]
MLEYAGVWSAHDAGKTAAIQPRRAAGARAPAQEVRRPARAAATLHPRHRIARTIDSGAAAPTLMSTRNPATPPMKSFPLLISLHAQRESAGRVRLPPVICERVSS